MSVTEQSACSSRWDGPTGTGRQTYYLLFVFTGVSLEDVPLQPEAIDLHLVQE